MLIFVTIGSSLVELVGLYMAIGIWIVYAPCCLVSNFDQSWFHRQYRSPKRILPASTYDTDLPLLSLPHKLCPLKYLHELSVLVMWFV